MILPTFLVIGAQKCGTTSLYLALKQHPSVYLSPVKEPRYFAFPNNPPDFKGPGSELFKVGMAVQPDQYAALFRDSDGFPVKGEASPIYLSSYQPDKTAKFIHNMIPDARLIAVLRQPAQRAWSAFLHHHRLGIETFSNFSEALKQEKWRKEQNWYPGWRYFENGLYAQNLKPYLEHFTRKQIKIFLFEEWIEKPVEVLREIFQFLEVDPSFQLTSIPKSNRSLVPRSPTLNKIIHAPHPLWCKRVLETIGRWNLYKPEIPGKIYKSLTQSYEDEIIELEKILGRDLQHWLRIDRHQRIS